MKELSFDDKSIKDPKEIAIEKAKKLIEILTNTSGEELSGKFIKSFPQGFLNIEQVRNININININEYKNNIKLKKLLFLLIILFY